jgi:hypothetical protein
MCYAFLVLEAVRLADKLKNWSPLSLMKSVLSVLWQYLTAHPNMLMKFSTYLII